MLKIISALDFNIFYSAFNFSLIVFHQNSFKKIYKNFQEGASTYLKEFLFYKKKEYF